MATPLSERLFNDDDREPIDPYALFEEWFAAARETELNDPHAMALATVDESGLPDVRMVLLNARDAVGFCFFTNFASAKGTQLLARPQAALLFHWKSQRRQVRLRGPVVEVTPAEADAYFATRPRRSQLGAHASEQSRPLAAKEDLRVLVAAFETQFADGTPVPRPAWWSGFRLIPSSIEFWQDGPFRLHDRMLFKRHDRDAEWSRQRLYP